jgi:integrase/recombinase XerD
MEGFSTHSFRRTALTQMSNAGIPLRVIQKLSGHRSLAVLQEYLEVGDAQVRGAANSLSALGYVRKRKYSDVAVMGVGV